MITSHENKECPRPCITLMHLPSERSERVRYRVEHKKIEFVSTGGHVIFFLLHKHTNDDVFDDFPKISEHFAKISEDSSKVVELNTRR